MKEKIIKVTDFISNGCFFLTCVAKYVILSFAFYYVVTYYDIRYIMLGTYTMQMSKKIKSYSKERYVPRYYSTRKKKIIMNHSFKNENSRAVSLKSSAFTRQFFFCMFQHLNFLKEKLKNNNFMCNLRNTICSVIFSY